MPKDIRKLFILMALISIPLSGLAIDSATLNQAPKRSTTTVEQAPNWLKPYSASYTIYRDGDNSGKAIRSIKKTNQNWELTSYSKAKVFFFTDKRTEKSIFRWQQILLPQSYSYQIKNSFKKQLTKEFFDWDLNIIRGTRSKKGAWQIPLKEGVSDPLSHQLLLRKQLVELSHSGQPFTKKTFSYNVSSKGAVQQRQYQLIAEEKITTKAGEFDSYKLVKERGTRKTIFWMAKQLDFIPIKIYQEKDGDEQATMILNKIEFKQ